MRSARAVSQNRGVRSACHGRLHGSGGGPSTVPGRSGRSGATIAYARLTGAGRRRAPSQGGLASARARSDHRRGRVRRVPRRGPARGRAARAASCSTRCSRRRTGPAPPDDRPARAGPRGRARRRPAGPAAARVDAVCHQAAMVGHGVDPADAPGYAAHNDLGTAVLLAAMHAAGVRRLVLAGLDGRLRRGPLRLPGARRRAPAARGRRPTSTPGASSRAARVAAATWSPGSSPRTPRSTRAAPTPPPRLPRSTWSRRGRGRPAARRGRCATTTSTGRGCRATPRTRASRRSSGRRWSGARRRGCWRTARQRRDFVHVTRRRRGQRARAGDGPARGGLTAVNVCSGEPHTIGDLAARSPRRPVAPSP